MHYDNDKAYTPGDSHYEVIASSDEFCWSNCGGGSIPKACLDGWSESKPNTGASQSTKPSDPRDVEDLSERYVGQVDLLES